MTEHRDRDRLIDELIAVGRDAVERGLVLASGGNLSARVSENSFVVTASGTWLDRLTPGDFVELRLEDDETGKRSTGSKPSSEWKLHHRAYLARPDAACVIHLHPRHAVVLASIGHEIRLLTLDHAFYVGSVGLTPFYHNGSDELADTAAEQLRSHNCVVMQHHGCSVVGDSVEMTYRRALNLEDAAKATALALQLGDTDTTFPPEAFAEIYHA
ncbi:class II aldolase/adducin family protein [Leucobacter coleopterorum]|uniref:Class II aldolase/adducin family protein n=1 Tax=Leucobacter coleopterorum TaxID=2714933 RepID=A0ABX6JYK0_9MICO|nr:class II aldolase/adducin family protein [Leucobacter coleopterorum]QIM17924.1 class II aldolase/adducin family protein [Leucobacter coleopterorum]